MNVSITHIGTATMLLEIGALRLLTDPVFDPAGGRYHFGWGTGSIKLSGPALPPAQIGQIDAVLLSHDHHEDNLDKTGRALLPRVGRVLTTEPGARRLRGNAEGLQPWQSVWVEAGSTRIKVTATPAQHGALLTRPLAGATIGFVIEWDGQRTGTLYISGDTIYYPGIDQVAERFRIGVAILHLGKARFPITGPLRYTMDSNDAVKTARVLRPQQIIPIHYEGWKHFSEGKAAIENAFTSARLPLDLCWLTLGQPTTIAI
jgi:L-ascorbate metabolism protein UlaG (beta-lactamase superfamily)